MSQTKNHCEPLVAVWLRPSTTEPCICCKQVAEKPLGEHLKMMYITILPSLWCNTEIISCEKSEGSISIVLLNTFEIFCISSSFIAQE